MLPPFVPTTPPIGPRLTVLNEYPIKCPTTILELPLIIAPRTTPPTLSLSCFPLRFHAPSAAGYDLPGVCFKTATESWKLIDTIQKLAWVSVCPRFGSLPWNFFHQHSAFTDIPLLLLEPIPECLTVCAQLFPSATIDPTDRDVCFLLLRDPPSNPTHPISEFLARHPAITGLDSCCPFLALPEQRSWLRRITAVARIFARTRSLACVILSLSLSPDSTADTDLHYQTLSSFADNAFPDPPWAVTSFRLNCASLGDTVAAHRCILIATTQPRVASASFPPYSFEPAASAQFSRWIRPELNVPSRSLALFTPLTPHPPLNAPDPFTPLVVLQIHSAHPHHASLPAVTLSEVFDPDFPAPEPAIPHTESAFGPGFCIPFTDATGIIHVRSAHSHEFALWCSIPVNRFAILTASDQPLARLVPAFLSCVPFATADVLAAYILDAVFHPMLHPAGSSSELVVHSFASTTSGSRPMPSP